MQQPIEIDVDEQQQVLARVAAIDVAKASGMVCTRVPHESIDGRRVTKVWSVGADADRCWSWPIIWSARVPSGWSWNQPRTTGAGSITSWPRGG